MTSSTKIIAAVLVALAVLLGVLAIFVGRRPPPPPQAASIAAAPQIKTYPVVVASRGLNAGQKIPADAVRVVQQAVAPNGAYTRVEDVVGHTPRVGLETGMPLTNAGLNQGLPLILSQGERGVAIPVDEIVGAGNAIQPGDYVDVFVSVKVPSATVQATPVTDRTIARLLIPRLRVLSYGADSLAPVVLPGSSPEADRANQRQQAKSAVLAVPIADVDQLILATQTAKLTLALRYPEDLTVPDRDLFPAPNGILTARGNLSADGKARLFSVDNRAFAGTDSLSLLGESAGRPTPVREPVTARRTPRLQSPSPGEGFVEVIRGSNIQREPTQKGVAQ